MTVTHKQQVHRRKTITGKAAGHAAAGASSGDCSHRERHDREKIRESATRNASLAAERDTLRRILDGIDAGIQIVDRNGDILYANRGLRREFGRVAGHKCHEYFNGLAETCPWCERHLVLAGRTIRREWQSAKTGKTYDQLSVPIHIADGSLAKLDILQDISRHKIPVEELSRSETRLHSVSAELLRTQEAERAMVSRRLHDEFGQALGALKLHVGMLRKQLGEDGLQLSLECSEVINYLDQVIEDARRLSYELCPSILHDLGVSTALRRLVEEFAIQSHCRVRSRIATLDGRLPKEVEMGLYRIIQAALTNIEKHAAARNVAVVVENAGRRIKCLVEDDGRGFDPAELESRPTDTAMGLAVMRERARMMGADLELWSRKGVGTRVRFHVPVPKIEPKP